MKKTGITIIALVILFTGLLAEYSDGFLNGAYTEWILNETNIDAALDPLGDALHAAHYNHIVLSTVTSGDNPIIPDVDAALTAMDNDDLDVTLIDYFWDAAPGGNMGMYMPSSANHYRFEAEFKEKDDPLVGDPSAANDPNYTEDKYFYYFDHNDGSSGNTYQVGRRGMSSNLQFPYSNRYAWICDEDSLDQAGMALDDLRWKWGGTPTQAIGPEFKFPGRLNDTYIYITFALNWTQAGYDPDAVIANVSLMMKRDDPNDNIPAEMIDMALIPLNSSYSTALKISDLSNASQDINGNYLFTYKINQNIATLRTNKFTQGANELLQIEPRLYWNGISRLVIDYVDIEDTIYRSLTGPNATTIKANIVNRVNQLTQGHGNM